MLQDFILDNNLRAGFIFLSYLIHHHANTLTFYCVYETIYLACSLKIENGR